jgi:hypothetical protein
MSRWFAAGRAGTPGSRGRVPAFASGVPGSVVTAARLDTMAQGKDSIEELLRAPDINLVERVSADGED